MLNYASHIDPAIPLQASVGALATFSGLGLASIFNYRSRTFLYMGGAIASLSMMVLMASFAGSIAGSRRIMDLTTFGSFLLTLMYTLYDTQMALAASQQGMEDVVSHAMAFYFNLFRMFTFILRKLSEREEDNQRKNRRRY